MLVSAERNPIHDKLYERIRHEAELRRITDEAKSKALELQAREYERRLDALNGEQSRVATFVAMLVTREKFEDYITVHNREFRERHENIEKRFSKIERQLATYAGGLFVLMMLLSIASRLVK